MPDQNVYYLRMTGIVRVELDNIPLITASRVSLRVTKPVNKQKSATIVGIAEGIPDVSGNIKMIPDAEGRGTTPQDLVLSAGGRTLTFIWGAKRYNATGVVFNDASLDNDPGAASLDNTVGFEAAIIKKVS